MKIKSESDFKKIADNASLTFKIENDSLMVSSKFVLLNRFNIGILLFLACSLFLIAVAILEASGTDRVMVLSLGIVILIISLVTLVKQHTDFLLVTNQEIVFRNSLRKRKILIAPDLKVEALIERKYTKATTQGNGSYSREVDLVIEKGKNKYRILDFVMEDKYKKEAKLLSKTIVLFINKKIEDSVADKNEAGQFKTPI